MALEAICSCKLFRTSSRQDKILAALNDPNNVELVQQLSSYLDEDSLPKRAVTSQPAPRDTAPSEGGAPEGGSEPGGFEGHGGHPTPSFHGGGGGGGFDDFGGDAMDDMSGDMTSDTESLEQSWDDIATDTEDAPSDTSEPDTSDEPVEEAEAITAVDEGADVINVNDVKEMLNSEDSTSGVTLVMEHGDELWIHYNDKTNLNNIMEPVITALAKDGYNTLEFNRLARSENAIVFVKAD